MLPVLIVLCFLPYTAFTGPLPAGEYGEARIDNRRAARESSNENFLNALLGIVNSNDGSNDIKPLIQEQISTHTKKLNDGDDEHDGYGIVHSSFINSSITCRELLWPEATTPTECYNVKIKEYEPHFFDRNDRDANAFCRWDAGLGKNQPAGCFCPRTKSHCHEKDQCHFYKSKSDEENDDQGKCIHNSERFYNILARLLSKRGKKDFALKIKYSSAAAKSKLPYGPWGPSFIDYYGEPYRHPYTGPGYNNFGDDYQNEYDYGYKHFPQLENAYDVHGALNYIPRGYGHGGYNAYPAGYQGYNYFPQDAYAATRYSPSDYGHGGYYGNPAPYQGYNFPSPNYHSPSNYFNGQQDYIGYPNSGISYGQGYAAYPQNIYQNGGGYSPVNTPHLYHNTVGNVTPSGPYQDEFVQANGGGYSPVNTPPSYRNPVGTVTPSGPYPEEFVQTNYETPVAFT